MNKPSRILRVKSCDPFDQIKGEEKNKGTELKVHDVQKSQRSGWEARGM